MIDNAVVTSLYLFCAASAQIPVRVENESILALRDR